MERRNFIGIMPIALGATLSVPLIARAQTMPLPATSINVKTFGAAGDGVIDDTAAIQAAINYCESIVIASSLGAALYFPAGQYKTNNQLNVTQAIVLHGDGCGATKFKTNNNYVFECTAGAQFRDLFFAGPYGAQSNGINLVGANNAIIERCTFQNQTTAVVLNASYAVEIIGCIFDVCYSYGIYASTSAHNLQVHRSGFFSCGRMNNGHAINLNVGSDNIGIKDNDFEECYINVQIRDCCSVEITGNYMEYAFASPLSFLGTNYGVAIDSNWIALGDSTGGGAAYQFQNIVGGSFRNNTLYNQTLTFNSLTVIGFTVGLNHLTGSGSIGDAWIPPALANNWTQQLNYSTTGYTKDQDGWVSLRGAVLGGSAPSAVFTLPIGFRPAKIGVFAAASANGHCICTIDTAGVVSATVAGGNNMCFDGIRFYVGN